MRNFLLLLAAAFLLVFLSFLCFSNKVEVIRNDLVKKTQAKLDKNKVYGLDVDLVGKGYKTKLETKLSGLVLSKDEKEKALNAAKSINGIRKVIDDIEVAKTEVITKKLVFEPVVTQVVSDKTKDTNTTQIKDDISKSLSVDFSIEGVQR